MGAYIAKSWKQTIAGARQTRPPSEDLEQNFTRFLRNPPVNDLPNFDDVRQLVLDGYAANVRLLLRQAMNAGSAKAVEFARIISRMPSFSPMLLRSLAAQLDTIPRDEKVFEPLLEKISRLVRSFVEPMKMILGETELFSDPPRGVEETEEIKAARSAAESVFRFFGSVVPMSMKPFHCACVAMNLSHRDEAAGVR